MNERLESLIKSSNGELINMTRRCDNCDSERYNQLILKIDNLNKEIEVVNNQNLILLNRI